jgi:predicted secreted hydrolase
LKRLLVLCCCLLLSSGLAAQDVLGGLRDEGLGFAQVTPGKRLEFPRDHGAHPDFRIEWWYLTANLSDSEGRHWGLQWTLFRQALSPQPEAADGWQSNQIWMAHAAITTPEGHFHEQRFARGGIGQAGVSRISRDGYFNAWLDDWEWRSSGAALLPAELRFTVGEREISLQLEATGELVVNGIDGYSQKSAQGQASYYYSQPHIRVRGLVEQGLEKTELSGQGWLDREWSSQALAPNQQGWDWFSLHLDDGHKLMVYQLRHDDGEHWLSGNWIGPNGAARLLDRDAIELRSSATREVVTGAGRTRRLPLEWQLALDQPRRNWRIRPLYDQQWMDTSIPYWEGVVLVEDEAGVPSGVGYMELTGYE